MSKRSHKFWCRGAIAIAFEALILIATCAAQQYANDRLSLSVNAKDGTYQLALHGGQPIFTSRAAAEIDHEWLRSTDYPRHVVSESRFTDDLGSGQTITLTNAGLQGKPDLILVMQLYDQTSYATVQVTLKTRQERWSHCRPSATSN